MTAAIPLAHWADDALARFAALTGSEKIAELTGAGLLGERAMLGGFKVPGRVSAGGGCRLFETRNGAVALNLARPDDREMLPALFAVDDVTDESIATRAAQSDGSSLIARGREMGLAIASEIEFDAKSCPAVQALVSLHSPPPPRRRPLVVDLSALWAGPLATHLLWLAGADVIKVESGNRPDAMRSGDAAFFDLLNQGKASAALNLRDDEDRSALLRLVAKADIVVEAARPRGLRQLGIDAAQLVRQHPGQVWITITGHGAEGPAADWVGFGDDCGVAAGLAAAMRKATGQIAFVGDAIADPLTGIVTATTALEAWTSGAAGHFGLSMRGIAALALADESAARPEALRSGLIAWQRAEGEPFPAVPVRPATVAAAPGRDNRAVIEALC